MDLILLNMFVLLNNHLRPKTMKLAMSETLTDNVLNVHITHTHNIQGIGKSYCKMKMNESHFKTF